MSLCSYISDFWNYRANTHTNTLDIHKVTRKNKMSTLQRFSKRQSEFPLKTVIYQGYNSKCVCLAE